MLQSFNYAIINVMLKIKFYRYYIRLIIIKIKIVALNTYRILD